MYRISRKESTRLFKYVSTVEIGFNPWNDDSTSARELWRRLTSERLSRSNPKADVKASMPTDLPTPFAHIKLVDGSEVQLKDCSTMNVEELMSEIITAAMKIDNEWTVEGKELDDE
mmetsp:Transcript_49220/g.99061  ORF Transcript_49220/g.99061 Transcript_49220/m.99061 type:complete len:116 (-) Transcript_49220:95-442(-)